jgi:hypothetical protein
MELNDATNSVVSDDTDLSTVADDTGVSGETEQLYDENGDPIDPPEDEEEIELDEDLKLKLPKSQAEKLRLAAMRQADYTRKTQELAEARKAFEAERQSLSTADEQELTARANIALIDRQLSQFAQVNWNQWNETDPFEAQKAFMQYQQLKDARTNAHSFLERARTERQAGQQQETAKRVAEGAAELARDIPGWSPDLSAKLQDFGAKTFGLTKDDFDNVTDPRAVKLLHAAYQWHQHAEKESKAKSIQKQQEVAPAANVGKGKSAPPAGLDDRLSPDEWVRRRNAQLAKKRA